MKRRDVVRALRDAGFVLVRTTGPHDVYGRGIERITVPRHTEINEITARKILKQAGCAP